MIDHCLDWDDALPEDELCATEKHAARADLCVCLGTSLQITPACDLPMRALRKQRHKPEGGKVAIINLQATPKDRRAAVVIHDKVDAVMRDVMRKLNLRIPTYERRDAVEFLYDIRRELPASGCTRRRGRASKSSAEGDGRSEENSGASVALIFRLRSIHGEGCPIPWLHQCHVAFDLAGVGTHELVLSSPMWRAELPISLHEAGEAVTRLRLEFSQGATEPPAEVQCTLKLGKGSPAARSSQCGAVQRIEVVTCRVEYDNTEDGSDRAIERSDSDMDGQPSVVARKKPRH
mmetsp:Transcript_24277/g.66915  ORF Transcript_24277/g.66915 Transcript_24277/m.66915 type:complete len:291 (+) Transcript_24277:160-1032(+)